MIKTVNHPNYIKYNANFKREIDTFISEIFNAESEGFIGYIDSTERNFLDGLYLVGTINTDYLIDVTQDIDDCYPDYVCNEKVHFLERHLSVQICSSEYNTLVVTGAMGSGKSALVNYVLDHIKNNMNHDNDPVCRNCQEKEVFIVALNFNKGYSGTDCEYLLNKFRHEFLNRLSMKVKDKILSENIFNSFLSSLDDHDNEWSHEFQSFLRFIRNDPSLGIISWESKSISEKVEILFDWIHDINEVRRRIDVLGGLLIFLKNYSYFRRCCFILFFDNIDRLPDYAQNHILDEIFTFSHTTEIKTIVNIRLTNFGWVKGEGYNTPQKLDSCLRCKMSIS